MNLSIIHNINQNVDISKWEGRGGEGGGFWLSYTYVEFKNDHT